MNAYCVILCRHDFANPTSYPAPSGSMLGRPRTTARSLSPRTKILNSVLWASSIATFIRTFRRVIAHRQSGKLLNPAAYSPLTVRSL